MVFSRKPGSEAVTHGNGHILERLVTVFQTVPNEFRGRSVFLELRFVSGIAVGIEFVGGAVDTHDEGIDVEPLGEFFHDRHEGVEIEGGGHKNLLMILTELAVSEFRAVVQRNVNQLVLYLKDSYYFTCDT